VELLAHGAVTVGRAGEVLAALGELADAGVVGFSDDFHADKVDHAAGAPAGKYAVPIVTMRGTTVVQTYLVDRIPFHLRHI
jgi:hypothetical protein